MHEIPIGQRNSVRDSGTIWDDRASEVKVFHKLGYDGHLGKRNSIGQEREREF